MRMENISKHGFRMRSVLVIMALYMLVSFPLSLRTGEELYGNMVWNVFLAGLPLIFACLFRRGSDDGWGGLVNGIFALLWLLFFPNAPYMITDIIHISGYDFYLGRAEYSRFILSTDMTLWVRIVYIGIGIWIGMLSGMLSLQIVHRILRRRFGALPCGAALSGIFLLSGYGIYLGRFVRLNSWNLLHVRSFLYSVAGSASRFAVKFTLLYAFFICACYLAFCAFCPFPKQPEPEKKK